MINFKTIVLLLAVASNACAEELRYKIGTIDFTETNDAIEIRIEPPVKIDVLPGGKTWPWLRLDESGRIFAGKLAIDPRSGIRFAQAEGDAILLPNGLSIAAQDDGYLLTHGSKQCKLPISRLGAPKNKPPLKALQDANVNIAMSGNSILALITQFGADSHVSGYQVRRIDPATCASSVPSHLGNPDLLVELGSSDHGGWWITGSIEQTLMRSKDGKRWHAVKLPAKLSSLTSSYIVDEKQIWLAGILGDIDDHPNSLVYSADGGANWTSLKKDDPLLTKVPAGWLEGQKRKAY